MINKTLTLFLLALCAFIPFGTFAQCPGSMTASVVTTDASCPSSGTATVSTSPAANASFTYTLTAGPSGALLNATQSSNVFNALLPGNYTVQVSCGVTQTAVSFSILNTYNPITNVNPAVTLNCGSYAQGGTVAITVTGGSAPFVYSIVKSNDPNYADAASVYNSASSKTVSSYGTYQVRVKDACNQFYTSTIQVVASQNPATVAYTADNLVSCNPASYRFFTQLLDFTNNQEIDSNAYNALGGVKLRIYEQAAGRCAPTGPILVDLTHAPAHGAIDVPVTSSKKYFSQVITPCGDTVTSCFDASGIVNPYFAMTPIASGCGSMANPFLELITPYSYGTGIVYPLTIQLYTGTDATGTLIGTRTANTVNDVAYAGSAVQFQGLTPGTYFMTSTDACGHVNTQIINDPTTAGAPSLSWDYFITECNNRGITTQSDAATVAIRLNGFLPDIASAIAVITAGPGNIGDTAGTEGSEFIWINLVPGTYTAAITTSCGTTMLQFTVPANPDYLLKQNITTTASYTCGAGSGSVTATTDYNGALSPVFVLVNSSTNIAIDSNKNGLFSNIAAGQYFVRMKLLNNSWCTGAGYNINSNNVTIALPGAGPVIAKKLGVICEDINGNLLSTGTAYLTIAGVAPLLVEYKLTSASTWITYSSNAGTDISITGLTAGSTYDVRITACGITNSTQVTIGQLPKINTITSNQPCSGSLYELAMPQLSGASYEWKNPAGIIVSTSYNYTIPVYNPSYDGEYIGTFTWSGCVKRADTLALSSTLCGTSIPLPVRLASFTAALQNCTVALNWKIASASGFKGFEVERSTNAANFTAAANIPFSAETANYSFNDNSVYQGIVYYRLKMIDIDGLYQYSNTIAVNARCNNANTQWSVYPSLLQAGNTVTIKLYTADSKINTVRVAVTSVTGQQLYHNSVAVHAGQNSFTLPAKNFVAGTYLVFVYDNKGQRIGDVQKLVYTK